VASRRGRAGGYALIKAPGELTLGSVLRAIDGPIAPLPCISRTAYRRCPDCADEATCKVRHLFAGTYAAMVALMDGMTLAGARQTGVDAFARESAGDVPEEKDGVRVAADEAEGVPA
jgi:DNA-binding IscR family transcriptional regulator